MCSVVYINVFRYWMKELLPLSGGGGGGGYNAGGGVGGYGGGQRRY